MNKDIKKGILAGLEDIEETSEFQVVDIEIDKIIPNRKNFYRIEGTDIEKLANDIKENGLYHNLVVRNLEDERYEIISGERRYSAIKLLGWDKIPCRTISADEVDSEIILIQANARTRELNESEKLKQIERLEELYKQKKLKGEKVPGRTRDLIGGDLGLSGKQVGRYQKINKDLIPELKELIDSEKLTISNAAEFANLSEQGQTEILNILKKNSETINFTKSEAQNLRKTIEEKEKQIELKEKDLERQAEEFEQKNLILKNQIVIKQEEIEKAENKIKEKEEELKEELRSSIENEIKNKSQEETFELNEKIIKIEEEKKKIEEEKLRLEAEYENAKNEYEIKMEEIKNKKADDDIVTESIEIDENQIENIKLNAELNLAFDNLKKATRKATITMLVNSDKENFKLDDKNEKLIKSYDNLLDDLVPLVKYNVSSRSFTNGMSTVVSYLDGRINTLSEMLKDKNPMGVSPQKIKIKIEAYEELRDHIYKDIILGDDQNF